MSGARFLCIVKEQRVGFLLPGMERDHCGVFFFTRQNNFAGGVHPRILSALFNNNVITCYQVNFGIW